MGKKIFLAPLGCAKNQIDGELMLGGARRSGHEVTDSADDADVLVVNTCAFIDSARAESVDKILELAALKAGREDRRLVVTGCMAERYAEELRAEVPEVEAFVGTGALDKFADAVDATGGQVFRGAKHYLPSALMDRELPAGDGSAYVKVSEGCDHECSFCVIPQIRGLHESRPIEDIAAEAENLAAKGFVELNLIAQDLSAYGRDLGISDGLAALLHRLGRVDGIERLRCYYLYPNTLADSALDAMASVDTVCSYVDLPLQHADPGVLQAMRRARDADQLLRIVERIRAKLGDPVMRTTFIVGFPGETDAAFERLKDFVAEVRFDHLSVFSYSREEGSAAAELEPQVPAHVAEYRRDVLIEMQESIAAERLARFVGSNQRVLVCGTDPDAGTVARTRGQGPDIDGFTYLGSGNDPGVASPGRLVDVRITGADAYDLFGEIV